MFQMYYIVSLTDIFVVDHFDNNLEGGEEGDQGGPSLYKVLLQWQSKDVIPRGHFCLILNNDPAPVSHGCVTYWL